MDAPTSRPPAVKAIFQTDCEVETRTVCALPPAGKDMAAMTCGMPLPRACSAYRIVSQRSPAKPKGSRMKALHQCACIRRALSKSAASASQAHPSKISATQAAPRMKSAYLSECLDMRPKNNTQQEKTTKKQTFS